jgi:hypothetical protein
MMLRDLCRNGLANDDPWSLFVTVCLLNAP